MRIVGFLQNAWSPVYVGHEWPRDSWLEALRRSRTGKRIAVIEDVCGEIEWHNTTPQVGETPDSILPCDAEHVSRILARGANAYVLCGRQAQRIVCGSTPTLLLPHPTYRPVTNELFHIAGKILAEPFTGVVELIQRRGSVEQRRMV